MTSQNLTFEQLPNQVSILIDKVQQLSDIIASKQSVNENSDDLLTRKEGRDLLGVTDPTFWKYAKLGKIKTYKICGRVYVKKSEILDVISNHVTKK